jgi:alkanesulfonate monooxygenase SsuD/methylene tetrahydromethanopterin reductase-like flavin-dependent oxidoreductase (luciferase family)
MGQIRRMAKSEFGRDPAEILAATLFFVMIDEERDAAVSAADGLRRREAWRDRSIEEMGEAGIALIGHPDDVARHINRFVDIGVEYFTLGFVPISTAKESIRRMRIFADGVMPQFV